MREFKSHPPHKVIEMKSYIEKDNIKEWLSKLDEALAEGKKSKGFVEQVKGLVSLPRRKRIKVNLRKLDKLAKEGEYIIVPGKVLGVGRLSKKLNISAVEYSGSAVEKIKQSGSKILSLDEALNSKDPKLII